MDLQKDIPLRDFTTMKLGGLARFFGQARTLDEIEALCRAAREHDLPIFVLGGGSNTIALDDGFDGIVLHNCLEGFEVISEDAEYVTVKVAAGEDWDTTVKKTIDMNCSGIEALSGIPGTVGAAPVQNIGAYGQEVSSVITEVDVYEIATGDTSILTNEACDFGYRSSIFRTSASGRYIITAVTMKLARTLPQPPFYTAVEQYLTSHSIFRPTVHDIRDCVLAIRTNKLPDPAQFPNAGSFFKNAIVERWRCEELSSEHPDMPFYPMSDDTCKIPTGWLIEHLGFKGQLLHGIRIHPGNALVLINESAQSSADLITARDEIAGAIRDTFQITLEQEPLVLRA